MMTKEELFPEMITKSKQLNLDIVGAVAWILKTQDNRQIVIMQFNQDFSSVEPHVNECSQWGIVLDGETTLYTDHEELLEKGDTFFIPSGVPHRVKIKAGYKDITIFDGPRYDESPKIIEGR